MAQEHERQCRCNRSDERYAVTIAGHLGHLALELLAVKLHKAGDLLRDVAGFVMSAIVEREQVVRQEGQVLWQQLCRGKIMSNSTVHD